MKDKQYKKAYDFLLLIVKNDNQNVKKQHITSKILNTDISNRNIHNYITQVARILYTHTGIKLYQIRKKSFIYVDKKTALELNIMPPPFEATLVPLSREIKMKSYFLEKRMEIIESFEYLKNPITIFKKVENEDPCYITDFITFYEDQGYNKVSKNQDVMIDVIDNISGDKQVVSIKEFLDYSIF
jgi:hypothetical protein